MSKKVERHFMKLPVRVLKVDRYQKKIRPKVVKQIVNEYNDSSFAPLQVSARDDGTFYVFDGQNRTEAAKKLGIDVVDCFVYYGMTYEEEAQAFLDHQNASSPSKAEEHYGAVEALDARALVIENTLNNLGLRIGNDNTKYKIRTVSALYEIYDKQNSKTLSDVLEIIKESFPEEDAPFSADMIKGIGDIYQEYKTKIDKKWFIKTMKKTSTGAIKNKAELFKNAHGLSSNREATKMAIIQQYNHRKSERLKLK